MDINQFIKSSFGQWRSQRSAHHLIFSHFEAVQSVIDIVGLAPDDPAVLALCQNNDIDPQRIASPFRMSWEGESDWNEDQNEELKGTTVLVPVPDLSFPNRGKLLRDQGYAETMPAVGDYHLTDDGTFVLLTQYERAAAEEKIWFVNPNLRFRISMIKSSDGVGVITASFSSEIRSLKS
ncbi:MAG: phycobiliprotein lyase [Calothrix sp. C42_A2020_038]|nr:phycobiliprotein lyase [Calothrix sp. C42_A2020_038]